MKPSTAALACTTVFLTTITFVPGVTRVAAAEASDDAAADGTVIREIHFQRDNVFDLDNPEENNWLYRLANRFHILTRETTLDRQLLFEEGEQFDGRLAAESERILRGNKYLYDASISPIINDDGSVDVTVQTRDVWTLMPEISFSRSGGENTVILGLEEANLFGRGQRVLLTHREDVDRRSDSLFFSARQLGDSWVGANLGLSDNSDGHRYFLNVNKPFHSLDARRAGGISLFDNDAREALYVLGDEAAEYRGQREYYRAHFGWSPGLRNDWARRFSVGLVYDRNKFSDVREPEIPQLVPADRDLVYPYLSIEVLEDQFEKTANSDQIERSEDFYLGTRLATTIGWADESYGADRDALLYTVVAGHSYGSLREHALLLSANASGRVESGTSANLQSRLKARYYWRQSDKRLFFALIEGVLGNNLDIDSPVELGGDSGLRGYPLRYQQGERSVLITLEQRYYTDWYPFNLVRIGGAVFFDAGKVEGDDPLNSENLGWLKDVGFGIRLAPTRLGTRKVYHIDIAFPLDGDDSIDDVQVLLEAKLSF